MDGLPFREVWAVDFEFRALNGERPEPVCLVAKELRSGRLLRLWRDDFGPRPPYPTDPGSLFVSFYAPAELACHKALGWPVPERILDLFTEFRAAYNGVRPPAGWSLLSALSVHGIPAITTDAKQEGRNLAMQGAWTASERRALLDYCQTDVDPLGPLLATLWPRIVARSKGLGQALLRGRYTAAVAAMEHVGVPIDTDLLARLRAQWEPLKLALIAETDRDYGVYDGATFKLARFEKWVADRGIPWPRSEAGTLLLDKETFKDQAAAYPEVNPLRELRVTLAELRLERLAVGADGRNRMGLSPFRSITGRNQPSTTAFVFGPSRWVRGLIRPEPGRGVAYLDFASQEIVIAAAMSGDRNLMAAVESGDPYMHFAKLARLAPKDATKQTHGDVRALCKTCLLGSCYGMGARSLAQRTGASLAEAELLLRSLAEAFPAYWAWSELAVDQAMLTNQITSVFGWPLQVTADTKPNTLRNFKMQANGAEMLRLACCLATERGVAVCAPVHDALLIEAPADDLDQAVEVTRAAMVEASQVVLDGPEVAVDAALVRHPDRYMDERGEVMWHRVMRLLNPPCAGP
jgi:DNA polymerase I